MDELTIYQWDGDGKTGRIIAPDTDAGRVLASQVLTGTRSNADAAEPTGLSPGPLTSDQQYHLSKHGWAPTD